MQIISTKKAATAASVYLKRNVLFSSFQAILSAFCVFLTIRLVITGSSLSEFGVASVLLAIGAASKIGDVGGSGALGRLIPAEIQNGLSHDTASLVKTTITSSVICFALISAIGVFFADFWLRSIFANDDLALAQAVLPLVAVYVVTSAFATAVASAIDGMQRADIRSGVMMLGYLTLPLSTYFFTDSLGISGYVLALIIQQLFVAFFGWLVLGKLIIELGFPFGWKNECFYRTISYVLRLNMMTMFALIFEPIIKVIIQVAGGSNASGLYEIASRAVSQLRNLVVSASTPLVPRFAAFSAQDASHAKEIFRSLAKWYTWAAVATALILAVAAPIVSILVLKELNTDFIIIMAIISVGWSFSIIALPFYFFAQAQGILRWNIIGHMMSITIIFTYFLIYSDLDKTIFISSLVAIATIFSSVVFIYGNLITFSTVSEAIEPYAKIWIFAGLILTGVVLLPLFSL